jgi:hypothetical protein
MRRSAGHSLGLFAALTLAAEAQAAPPQIPASDTTSLADKLATVRALIPTPQQQGATDDPAADDPAADDPAGDDPAGETSQLKLLPGMRLAQWFNWGNWRNCANGNC